MAAIANEIAFAVGGLIVTINDVARAWAVQDGCAEEFDNDQQAKEMRRQEVKDILDRAFRYARDREPVPAGRSEHP